MVAYSFNARFAEPITAGTKRQTLRNDRKRHAHVGETLQLYTGMRTRQCRLIGTATCLDASPIRLDFEDGRVEFQSGTAFTTEDELNAFAAVDGFAHWKDLAAFWRRNHPDVSEAWEGIRILWGATFKAPEPKP